MPPKAKYTRDQIIDAAFGIVREKGRDALSARSLARALNSSTGLIFASFSSIEEVQREVVGRAKKLYAEYVMEGLKERIPFKGFGMKYIRFAKDEPELFRMLFMCGDGSDIDSHFLPYNDDNSPVVLETVMKNFKLSESQARRLYNHMSVYAFGLASLFVQRIYMFTMEDISRMISEVFAAIITEEKGDWRNAEN